MYDTQMVMPMKQVLVSLAHLKDTFVYDTQMYFFVVLGFTLISHKAYVLYVMYGTCESSRVPVVQGRCLGDLRSVSFDSGMSLQ